MSYPPSRPADAHLRRDTRPLKRRQIWIRRLTSWKGLLGLAFISLALLAVAYVGGLFWLGDRSLQDRQASIMPPTSIAMLATEYPALATILQDPNMDSVYKEFLVAYQTGGEAAALELAHTRGLLNANGDLRLTLELDTTDTAALEAELEANWIEVTAVNENLMDIAIPLERLGMWMDAGTVDEFLGSITTLEHVVRVRLPKVGIEDAGRQLTTAEPPNLTPAAATPTGGEPSLVSLGLQAPNNLILVILGALACVVAPLLFALGAYLLLSGLGTLPRRSAPPSPVPEAPPARATADRPPAGPLARDPAAQPVVEPSPPPQPPAAVPETPAPAPVSAAAPPVQASGAARLEVGVPCPNCGRMNRSGARFCLVCGAGLAGPEPEIGGDGLQSQMGSVEQLPPDTLAPDSPALESPAEGHPSYCWTCGRPLRPTSRFCPHCGEPV